MSPPETKSAPTTEVGKPALITGGNVGIPGWGVFMDDREYAPDVQWPKSVDTYMRMQTDAQLKGLLMATTLPIRRMRWEIDPNGARQVVVDHIAESYNLPIRGQEAGPSRQRNRFSHDRHLSFALRALPYGHFYFERVYEVREDGLLHLAKLGTRPPRTIAEIVLEDNGDLRGIKQQLFNFSQGFDAPLLERTRLLPYIFDSEDDGDWIGRSMLRACFRNWIVKDRLIRVDATKHERNAMGIPWFKVDPAASQKQIDELAEVARAMRAGEESGGAGPGELSLKGVDGNLPDTIGSIREHDHQMSRAFLALFFELGTSETGSRSLGSDFIDFATEAQGAVADWYRDTTQREQIEDEVALNWGDDEQPPMLVYERVENSEMSISDLSTAVKAGLIAVDDELAEYIVRRWHLPRGAGKLPDKPPAPAPPPPGTVPAVPVPEPAPAPTNAQGRALRRVVATEGTILLPDRQLRRQPYEQEVAAQVDFAGMDASQIAERDALVAAVKGAQAEQITALSEAVQAANGDAAALASLNVDPIDSSVIVGHLEDAAAEGVDAAKAEKRAQLTTNASVRAADIEENIDDPDADEIDTQVNDRADAVALTLAGGLAAAASKRASAVAKLAPADAAADVAAYLGGLSDAALNEQLGGAVWQAYNTGRRETMRANGPKKVYASELLDSNTCEECTAEDGTEWENVDQAEEDYPQGGFIDCEGGLNCRGTLVATY